MVCVLSSSGADADGEPVTRNCGGIAGAAGLAAIAAAGVWIGFVAAGVLSTFGFACAADFAAAADSAARLMPVSLTCTPLPTWNGVDAAVRGASTGAGGGSEKVRSSMRTRMLLAVSGLLADAAGGTAGFAAGFAATGAAADFATTGAAGFAAGAFAVSVRAGCFAVSEVVFSAAGFSGVDFAFTTPEAADFAIAASAAGVNDGGSHVNSSRPSVGATAVFAAGAGLAAFAAGAFADVSGSQVSSMVSESVLAAFLATGGGGA